MAEQKALKGETVKQVTLDLLRQASEPLHAKEIAKRVIDSGRCRSLKGKTPEATITALLAVGAKSGGPFKRLAKATYTLADHATSPPDTGASQPERDEAPQAKPKSKRRAAKQTA